MTDIEVGLGSILGDEYFAMLERAHRAGVDIEVSVEFLAIHSLPHTLQYGSDRCCGDPLSDTREDTSCDEDKFHVFM